MRRTIVAGILAFTAASCTSWKPVLIQPDRYIRSHGPDAFKVRLRDGSRFTLRRPRVFLDSLRGVNSGYYRNVALEEIVGLQAEEPSTPKTVALIVVGAIATAVFIDIAGSSDRVQ